MARPAPYAQTVFKWLKDNGHNLAALTSTDCRALQAAVQIAALWSPYDHDGGKAIAAAWGACVREMQPHCQQFAFHAVAHVANWNDRFKLWRAAGFAEPMPSPCYRCKHEPQAPSAANTKAHLITA